MNKKTRFLFSIIFITSFFLISKLIYLQKVASLNKKDLQEKKILISSLGLPDLAISTEAMFIRHRSLSDIFAIFKESPELREYFPTTFTISHSHILNNTPSKVLNEK